MLIYSLESCTLKPMQGNEIVYLALVAPHYISLEPRVQGKSEWVNNLYDVLHSMPWILVHGLSDVASNPHQRGGSNTKHEIMTLQKFHNPLCIIT